MYIELFIPKKENTHSYQEGIYIVNIYAPNIWAHKYIRKILEDFEKDTDSNTLIVGDFKTPLSTMERSSKQRINKDIVALNNSRSNGLNCYIQNSSPQRSKTYILLKCTWNSFKDRPDSRTQNNPQQIQENWNCIKHFLWLQWLKTRNQSQGKKPQKHTNAWRLNNMLLNNEWVNNEIKEEIKNFLETN